MIRRCVTCRQALCGCTTTLPVNVTLWNLIKLLFPQDVATRQRSLMAEAAEARRARGGEDGGSHSAGFAVVEACAGVAGRGDWNNLGQWGMFGTRNMVLDAADRSADSPLYTAIATPPPLPLLPCPSSTTTANHRYALPFLVLLDRLGVCSSRWPSNRSSLQRRLTLRQVRPWASHLRHADQCGLR